MTARELPPAEWPRLADTELRAVWQTLPPAKATVMVVEEEGAIVGTCVILPTIHVDGFAIAESHRNGLGVFRLLAHKVSDCLAATGVENVIAGVESARIETMVRRVGGVEAPMRMFAVPVERLATWARRTEE